MILTKLTQEVQAAFAALGIGGARVTVSNRPDLADYMSDARAGGGNDA